MPAMTLNLPDPEWAMLERMAEAKTDSKTAVIRRALTLYSIVVLHPGTKIYAEATDGERSELVIL